MSTKRLKTFRTRLSVIVGLFLVWSCLIGYRLVELQILQYPAMRERARRQQTRVFHVSPKRGVIYDRKNRELAVSIKVESVFAVPPEVESKSRTAALLAAVLGLDEKQLVNRLKRSRSFCWIKRKVDFPEIEKVRQLNLAGVYFEAESKRYYPKRELAAHVLGYVGMDNEGLAGLEYFYEKIVRGKAGRVLLMTDAKNRSFSSPERPPTSGADLVLTMDESIQYLVEQELLAQVKKSKARGGTAIVMKPTTGEILAMANLPTFNPNHYGQYSQSSWRNRAILSIYEPGSTFKIFTAATALEEGLTTSEEQIHCMNGEIIIGNRRIRDHKAFGWLSVRDILSRSSNVGIIQLGFRIGKDRLERYIRRYGFGEPTRVDLPGEERGLLRPASDWPMITLGTISMGQGIGITPLQLVTAVGAIANGGLLVKPRVVKQIRPGDLSMSPGESQVFEKRVLRKETTDVIKEMMSAVVSSGTGRAAQLLGFSAAGKTGTAQKVDADGRYSHTRFVSSFVGFAPTDNPAVSIVIVIDEPHGRYYGGEVAAPVFKRIAEKTLSYLSVPPDRLHEEKNLARFDQVEESRSEEYLYEEPRWGTTLGSEGESTWTSETVALQKSHNLGGYTTPAIEGLTFVNVPSFLGKSLRVILAEGSRVGLHVEARGSGLVVRQSPAPNVKVAPGSTIKIQLQRNL